MATETLMPHNHMLYMDVVAASVLFIGFVVLAILAMRNKSDPFYLAMMQPVAMMFSGLSIAVAIAVGAHIIQSKL